jgi:hypothetical protein
VRVKVHWAKPRKSGPYNLIFYDHVSNLFNEKDRVAGRNFDVGKSSKRFNQIGKKARGKL